MSTTTLDPIDELKEVVAGVQDLMVDSDDPLPADVARRLLVVLNKALGVMLERHEAMGEETADLRRDIGVSA